VKLSIVPAGRLVTIISILSLRHLAQRQRRLTNGTSPRPAAISAGRSASA
jgi:hypothetical protein